MNAYINGIGTAVPAGSLTQSEAANISDALHPFQDRNGQPRSDEKRERLVHGLYRRSGVEKRHSVLLEPGQGEALGRQDFFRPAIDQSFEGPSTSQRMQQFQELAPGLALSSSRVAIDSAELSPSDIDHLVTVSCSGFSAPGVDIELIQLLGLTPTVSRTNVGFMGCYAALSALRAAAALAAANPGENVLVCATELCSLHHQYSSEPQQMVANSLFGDGSAAMIVSSKRGSNGAWQRIGQASTLIPDSADQMSWSVGDHGFVMTLSAEVPATIGHSMNEWLSSWLKTLGLSIDDIDHWAVHPGGPRILSSTAEALNIDRTRLSASDTVLAHYGNMSSPTLVFILDELARTNATGHCVALAFGPGLVAEAALLRRTSASAC